MKNNTSQTSYLSTTQAAHRLGLSVGTIQRMVEKGVLQAYTTQGGHRRILSTSLNDFCLGRGVPVTTPMASRQICVLHAHEHPHPGLQAIARLPDLKLISHPLELVGIHNNAEVFFVDARISWLPWHKLHLQDTLAPGAHFIVYNSSHLPEDCITALQTQAHLYPGDISVELIQGYLLGHAPAMGSTATAHHSQPHKTHMGS